MKLLAMYKSLGKKICKSLIIFVFESKIFLELKVIKLISQQNAI